MWNVEWRVEKPWGEWGFSNRSDSKSPHCTCARESLLQPGGEDGRSGLGLWKVEASAGFRWV